MTSRFQDYLSKRAAPPSLADVAVSLGMPVFPCGADKKPITSHGFKDASADPLVIASMFSSPAAVLIGVPTGKVSGWYVIDIDIKDGARGQEWLATHANDLVSTRTHKTRSGGLHLVFTLPSGQDVRNSASHLAPGVDVRGSGGYVIWPPSIGYSVADATAPAEMPEWLFKACGKPDVPIMVPTKSEPRNDGGTRYGLSALQRECDAVRSARDGQKHATLNKAAFSIGGLVTNGELAESVAYAELTAALESIRAHCKDWSAAQKTLRGSFHDGMGKPRPAPPPRVPVSTEISPLAVRLMAQSRPPAPLPVAENLLDVSGALRLFIDHCEATAMSRQPFLALAAGICLVGVLAGRKYRTATDLRTNIYAAGVAESGAGKDHARKQIKVCLAAANLTKYLGGEDLASGASVFTALSRHPAQLFQIDEFGDWLADVLGAKAPAHKKQIAQKLKSLYSSASTFLSGTEYADQGKNGRPKEDIQQPHACLYGTSTPGQLWTAVAGASMSDGLMARLLLFVSPCSYPDESEPSLAPPSEELIKALIAIDEGPADPATGELGRLMLRGTAPEPVIVANTPEAETAWKALRKEQLARQRKHEGTYVTAIVGRLAENAMKLALVRAVSAAPAAPSITAADVAWGRAVSIHCIDTLLQEADRHVADSEYEARMNKAREIIRKFGPLTERDMIRRGFKYPERERAEILKTLVEGGIIFATAQKADGPGRPTVRYVSNATNTGFETESGNN